MTFKSSFYVRLQSLYVVPKLSHKNYVSAKIHKGYQNSRLAHHVSRAHNIPSNESNKNENRA